MKGELLQSLIAEVEECKIVTVEDAKDFVTRAFEYGKHTGSVEELKNSKKDLQELNDRIYDRLGTILV